MVYYSVVSAGSASVLRHSLAAPTAPLSHVRLVLLRAEGLAAVNVIAFKKDAIGKDRGHKGKGNSGPINLVQIVACDGRR